VDSRCGGNQAELWLNSAAAAAAPRNAARPYATLSVVIDIVYRRQNTAVPSSIHWVRSMELLVITQNYARIYGQSVARSQPPSVRLYFNRS